jgi:hypothetical protein
VFISVEREENDGLGATEELKRRRERAVESKKKKQKP